MKVYGSYSNIFSELNQKCNGYLHKSGNEKNINIVGKIHELTLFANQVSKDKVYISQEGLEYMKGNLHKGETVQNYMPMPKEEQGVYDYIQAHLNVNTLTTCDSTEIISKDLWKLYEDLQSKEANVLDINSHVRNMMNAYTHMYNKIIDGYNDGTREVWMKDNSTGDDFNGLEFMSNGRIERYRKLTMEEELATLDHAFEKHAKDIEDSVNYAIMIDRVSPSALKTMEELKKMNRIIEREFPEAHRENLIVLDATTGQNALQQAKEFGSVTDLTGIILTKMDGTAKGGIAVAIQSELQVPVKYIGVGEKLEDLQKFDAEAFVNALFDVE